MKTFVLIVNGPPFVGVEELLPKLADALGTGWLHIDPLSQLLELGGTQPPELAWGLHDAITTALAATARRRSLVLGWRTPVQIYRRFERAVAASRVLTAAATFAPPPDSALHMAGKYALADAARHEVIQFYRRGCHRLCAGIRFERAVGRPEVTAQVIERWARAWFASASARGRE
jgi:hypothetical protein